MLETVSVLFGMAFVLLGEFFLMDYLCYKSYLDKLAMINELYPMGSTERDLAINIVNICFDPDRRFYLRRARKHIK